MQKINMICINKWTQSLNNEFVLVNEETLDSTLVLWDAVVWAVFEFNLTACYEKLNKGPFNPHWRSDTKHTHKLSTTHI